MALSTLHRHLKQQRERKPAVKDGGGGCPLVEMEIGASVVRVADGDQAGALTVWLCKSRSVCVGSGFDGETLRRLVTVLERV